MKARILSFAVSVAILMSSCSVIGGNTIEPSEKRVQKDYTGQLKSFDKIETATTINVVYTQDEGPQKVVLDVPENMAEYVRLTVKDGELDIWFEKIHRFNGTHRTTLYVSGPAIRKFETSSAAAIHLKNGLKYDGEVSIETSSAGNVYVDSPIIAKALSVEASSAGNISINGAEVEKLDVESSSAGNIKVNNIKAVRVEAEASSAGNITLEGVCRMLDREQSSAGGINTKNLKLQQ